MNKHIHHLQEINVYRWIDRRDGERQAFGDLSATCYWAADTACASVRLRNWEWHLYASDSSLTTAKKNNDYRFSLVFVIFI